MEIEFGLWTFPPPCQTGLAAAGSAVEEISPPVGNTALGVPSLQTEKGASVVRHVRGVASNHIRSFALVLSTEEALHD